MNTPTYLFLRFAGVAAAVALFAGSAQAHTVYARVISAQPEYTQVHFPQRVCNDHRGDRHRRNDDDYRHRPHRDHCYTVDRVENRLTGYRVTYDHRGRIGTTYTRHHPGRTIAIEVTHSRHGY